MLGDELEQRAERESRRLANRLHAGAIHLLRAVRDEDRASGLGPAQLSALSVLVFGGPRSLKQLAAAEQVRPPTMSRIVAALERAGMVARAGAADDGRKIVLRATMRGARTLLRARDRRVERVAARIAQL